MIKYFNKDKIEEELDIDTQSNINYRDHNEEHQSMKSVQLNNKYN